MSLASGKISHTSLPVGTLARLGFLFACALVAVRNLLFVIFFYRLGFSALVSSILRDLLIICIHIFVPVKGDARWIE